MQVRIDTERRRRQEAGEAWRHSDEAEDLLRVQERDSELYERLPGSVKTGVSLYARGKAEAERLGL